MLLKHVKNKYESEMRKYMKFKKMLVVLQRINDKF